MARSERRLPILGDLRASRRTHPRQGDPRWLQRAGVH